MTTTERPVAARAGDDRRPCPICGGPATPMHHGLYDDRYGHPGSYTVMSCPRCGHRSLAAEFTEAELASLYGDFYPRGTMKLEEFRPHVELTGLRAWLEGEQASAFRWVPRNVRVLDVGCGFGQTLAYHAARGCDAHGIDADANLLRVAEHYGLNARVGLFHATDYEPSSFDVVTLDQVIEHSSDPRSFLRGVATVLRPGGTAIISTPNSGGYARRLFGRRWINWHVPYHLHHFSRRSLSMLAEQAGLEVESIRTLTNTRWLLYQCLHLGTYPRRGTPSRFWDPRRSRGRVRRRERTIGELLYKAKLLHAVTRVADGLGVGDNILCMLKKPR